MALIITWASIATKRHLLKISKRKEAADLAKYQMTNAEKRELGEYRETGLSPRQIKAIKREAAALRDYIEFLENL